MLDTLIQEAMTAVDVLSRGAKLQGDLPTMYKANQAWHALHEASADRARRTAALSNGFFSGLTAEQKAAALAYDGPENHGDTSASTNGERDNG